MSISDYYAASMTRMKAERARRAAAGDRLAVRLEAARERGEAAQREEESRERARLRQLLAVDDKAVPTPSTVEKPEPVLKGRRALAIPENVSATDMLRLEVAARIAFPDGSMSASALRREAAGGRLTIYPIRNKHFTTLAHIEEMQQLCRAQAKVQGSRSSRPEAAPPCGTFATDSAPSALAALKATAQALSENSPPTSSASTIPEQAAAAVIPMRSRSLTR
ncbi:hypothetical protein [Bradyrhizobium sp. LMTR 3]|uniref:hypothetical protein n=1 Tax=Bradyrhizobium sp. LMTR 3 TaxID=189873 RepID=UPI001AECB666|nr:hypothetical protein [Bradyrhizobium sp. LMTR 3]